MTFMAKLCLKGLPFLIFSGSAFAQISTPILFKVQSPSGQVTSYLFGTFHFGIGLDEFPAYLRTAQDQTQIQYAEDNMIEIARLFKLSRSQPHEALEKLRQKFHAPQNPIAFTHEELDGLVGLGIPRDFALEMQDENCAYLFYRKLFFIEPFHSLEAELEQRAVAAGKPVVELDSETLSKEAYKNEPKSTCRVSNYLKNPTALAEKDRQSDNFRNWYRQMTPELALRLPDDTDDTVTIRTEAWIKTLLPVMQVMPVFVSVGLDHLIGVKGLIKLLESAGFTVTPFHPALSK